MQMLYLEIGRTLVDVRDRKLYAVLNHPDLESYAKQRLWLGRAALYRYVQVYEWAAKSQKSTRVDLVARSCPSTSPRAA